MYFSVLERFNEIELLQQINDLSNLEKDLLSDKKAKSRRRTLRNQKNRITIYINQLKQIEINEFSINNINYENNDNLIEKNVMSKPVSTLFDKNNSFEMINQSSIDNIDIVTNRQNYNKSDLTILDGQNECLKSNNIDIQNLQLQPQLQLQLDPTCHQVEDENLDLNFRNCNNDSTSESLHEVNVQCDRRVRANSKGDELNEIDCPTISVSQFNYKEVIKSNETQANKDEMKETVKEKQEQERMKDKNEVERNLDPRIPNLIANLSEDNIPSNPKTRLGWGFWKS